MKHVIILGMILSFSFIAQAVQHTSTNPISFGPNFVTAKTGYTTVFAGKVKKGITYTVDVKRKGTKHTEEPRIVLLTDQGEKHVSSKTKKVKGPAGIFNVTRTFTAPATGTVHYRAYFWTAEQMKKKYPTPETLAKAFADKTIKSGHEKIVPTSQEDLKQRHKKYITLPDTVELSVNISAK